MVLAKLLKYLNILIIVDSARRANPLELYVLVLLEFGRQLSLDGERLVWPPLSNGGLH